MIGKDKVKHFVVSFLLTAGVYWLSKSLILAAGTTLLFGLAKELYDQVKGKNTIKESVADFSVNILGIIFGVLVMKLLIPNT
ncbi:MAG: hypothetical protein WC768_02330 [Patescibacteria group bacterium]|jgi:hypothetical protein